MRYEDEIIELVEQKLQLQRRIAEVKAELKEQYNRSTWWNNKNKRLDALYGNLDGVNEAITYLINYQRGDG